MLSESATLILSTASTVGSPIIDPSFTNITFRNVDLKQTLGEMWEKYDRFIIKPVGITQIGTTVISGSSNNIITYNMAGLDWININYEMAPGQQRWVPMCSLITNNGAQTISLPFANNGWGYNFRKGQQFVDLQFIITVPAQLNMAPPSAVYTNVDMHFVIEPCIEGKMNEIAFFGFCTDTALNVPGRFVDSTRKIYNYPSYDMRRQCSEFWHLHEEFEIMHSWNIIRGVGTINNDARLSPMQISGLNFVNNYTKQGNNTATQAGNYSTENAILGTTLITNVGSSHSVNMLLPFAPIQFKKDSDNVNLTLTFKNFDNTALATPTFTAPQPYFMYGFYIRPTYGVDKATLNINPWGLTTTETNLGIRDSSYNTFTLKNIDMRMVCRSMWHKYNKFNIFLTSTAATVSTGNANNAAILMQMEGLDFVNQTAWISNTAQSQTAVLGAIYNTGSGTEPRVFGNQSSHGTMFYKTSDLVDIKLTALPLNPATPFLSTMQPLAANYTFTIVGVEE
jgi:hypothetical protein